MNLIYPFRDERTNLHVEQGQGVNHSITDAGNLVESQKTNTHQCSAISQYEEEMIIRAGEELHLSIIHTKMLDDWSKVIESPVLKSALTKQS